MPSGKKYSRKKISHIARERLTYDNVLYTQLFIDYLKSQDVRTVKFFDEAGIKVPDVGDAYLVHNCKQSGNVLGYNFVQYVLLVNGSCDIMNPCQR